MDFWMVWVPGHGGPKRMYDNEQEAIDQAKRLRAEKTTREVYVLKPVFKVDGRKILTVKNGRSIQNVDVEKTL